MNNAQELIDYISKTLPDVEVTTAEVALFTSVSLYATVHHEGRSWEKSAAEWYATDLEEFRDAEGISGSHEYVKQDATYTSRIFADLVKAGEKDENGVHQIYSVSARTRPGPRFQIIPLEVDLPDLQEHGRKLGSLLSGHFVHDEFHIDSGIADFDITHLLTYEDE